MEYLFSFKHLLKLLWKSKNFPQRYKTKREWVFFWTQCKFYMLWSFKGCFRPVTLAVTNMIQF